MTDFGQIHYLKIYLNNNMYKHTSLTVSSNIMPDWVGASKNNWWILLATLQYYIWNIILKIREKCISLSRTCSIGVF